MAENFIRIDYENRLYIINRGESLKSLLTHEELLTLPLSIWKNIFEQKDGICYFKLMIRVLEAEIKAYDTSSNVNSFYYKGKEYWLDKATRVGLQNLANCSSGPLSLLLGDEIIELELDKAKQFLSDLEIYAGKCFVNTNKHLIAIKSLKTIEDIINYNYTSGYPDKITLNE